MIRATIENTFIELKARDDLSVAEQDLFRDCAIALGRTGAKPATVREAWNRCKRAILNYIRAGGGVDHG